MAEPSIDSKISAEIDTQEKHRLARAHALSAADSTAAIVTFVIHLSASGSKTIERTLKSLQAQKKKNWEAIVVLTDHESKEAGKCELFEQIQPLREQVR
jgi:hypothetical protein